MSNLIECKHTHKSFVSSGRGMGNQHHIDICEECGKLFITATKDGVNFSISLHIHDEAQIEMLNKWALWVNDTDY